MKIIYICLVDFVGCLKKWYEKQLMPQISASATASPSPDARASADATAHVEAGAPSGAGAPDDPSHDDSALRRTGLLPPLLRPGSETSAAGGGTADNLLKSPDAVQLLLQLNTNDNLMLDWVRPAFRPKQP